MNLSQWLEKATFTTDDIDPSITAGAGGLLSPRQTQQFLRIAIEAQVIAREARIETSPSPKFEVPRLAMADRIMRAGVEGARVVDGDRVKPRTGLMELSTVLLKGEMPVTDELFEDQIERGAIADTLMMMLAQGVGRDIEELAIKGDTDRTAADDGLLGTSEREFMASMDGIVKHAQDDFDAGVLVDASTITSYEDLFAAMIEALPPRYRRNYGQLRFYVPVVVADGYQKSLSARGTNLGDQAIIDNLQTRLGYRGIPVVSVPLLDGESSINGTAIDYSKFCFLTPPTNIIFGYHRRVRVERWRDPRAGLTSYLPTVRFDVNWVNPESQSVMASNVDITV